MDFTSYVNKKKIEARMDNIAQVRAEIESDWVKEKIEKHLSLFEGLFLYEDIKRGILENDIIASKFCKDPSKQNISEKLCEEILHIKKLPQRGKSSIRFSDSGEIIASNSIGSTKAADFMLNGYYATQKFTTDFGGAQDNQRNDVIDFLKKGSINHKVAAILDGPYWDKYIPILKKEFEGNSNVLITSVTELTGGKDNGY